MNLRAIASGVTSVISGPTVLLIQRSTGYTTDSNFKQQPGYETPSAFTGAIAGNILTVAIAPTQGALGIDQTIAGPGVALKTKILGQLTGTPGGIGTYKISGAPQTVASVGMTSVLVLLGDIQPISTTDLRQLDALNITGVKNAIYINGRFDGVIRPKIKGGDLVTVSSGPEKGVYLVTVVFEDWGSEWCKLGVTLQNQQPA